MLVTLAPDVRDRVFLRFVELVKSAKKTGRR